MKKYGIAFQALAPLAVVAMVSAAQAQTVDRSSPDRMVRAAVEGVIGTIQSSPDTRSGDLGKITAVVQRQFLPYTDFERTTRLAVGSAWRNATPEQQKQLYEQFQTLLVRSYAVSLSQLREQNVKFRYKPALAASGATDVVVETRVLNNGDEMQIDYRLQRVGNGWKIYDINMMGAWLIEVYRRQFADIVARNGIDGLLKYLANHNARQNADA
ncbi:MlaC/ttg2D family ABC transporter substrate-binding protein [Cupriavidus basilensis]|uniref:MlaC/ttg2D family ABC transporter substrate-binding protein n=1 Tax=Cupriavidus TaxID=106589 RepID=UPI00044CBF60|nr:MULTISPECIES: ABC transporter substrate-binding protein [Cupriavidus]KDP86897.1 ABC transporter [Cupriavidus sp. SK-3]MDF3881367.1 ABC transporter substrate-binding protein [Cupriavidus basilensis]